MSNTKIVVAEDDRDLRQMLVARLKRMGLSVAEADNAYDALRLIHDLQPRIACLDEKMPRGSGLTVCEMISADQDRPRPATILLTGQSDPETIRRCHDLRVFYILKGSDPWARLEPLLSELLECDAETEPSPRRGEHVGP